jgi:signal transduction histidine kinase
MRLKLPARSSTAGRPPAETESGPSFPIRDSPRPAEGPERSSRSVRSCGRSGRGIRHTASERRLGTPARRRGPRRARSRGRPLPTSRRFAGRVASAAARRAFAHRAGPACDGFAARDARERELRLQRDLGHEKRLAGLGRIAAGVAHEVRNPLAVLKLKLEAMGRHRADERGRQDISVCLQEVARIDRTDNMTSLGGSDWIGMWIPTIHDITVGQ